MKILLTGASGFLGQSIYKELSPLNEMTTISRTGSTLNVDLAKMIPELPHVDLVVHAAGKAHVVPRSMAEKDAFFEVNLNGTHNLLKGLEKSKVLPDSFVFISTVAVYGCEAGVMINESRFLDAKDPYGQSKIQAEQLVQDWCRKNNVICTILRLPLLVGKNPPGNLGAMIRGIEKGYYFNIAGGKAKKSMVLAADVARVIPLVAVKGGIYNLTDGNHPSFEELSASIANQLGKGKPLNIPLWFAKIMAGVGDLFGEKMPINNNKLNKITADLTFDDRKARELIQWKPMSVLNSLII